MNIRPNPLNQTLQRRRPAGQSDGSDNLSAIVAADRAFPAAVAEALRETKFGSRLISMCTFRFYGQGGLIPNTEAEVLSRPMSLQQR